MTLQHFRSLKDLFYQALRWPGGAHRSQLSPHQAEERNDLHEKELPC